MSVQRLSPRTSHDSAELVSVTDFGVTMDGRPVKEFTIRNKNGVSVSVIEYGSIVRQFLVPGRVPENRNIVLSYPTLRDYENCQFFVGATIGQCAGRIANGVIRNANEKISLDVNWGADHIHGGSHGFHKKLWHGDVDYSLSEPAIIMRYKSADGASGYPGSVDVTARYQLFENNQLSIEWHAEVDTTSYVNLTHHGYFNLSGDYQQSIDDHRLVVESTKLLAQNDAHLPTGEIRQAEEFGLDFCDARTLGDRDAISIDHDFVLPDRDGSRIPTLAGELRHKPTRSRLRVFTTQPALHVYTGDALGLNGDSGFKPRSGLCMETQGFPNAPNIPSFPSVRLEPGQTYEEAVIYEYCCD